MENFTIGLGLVVSILWIIARLFFCAAAVLIVGDIINLWNVVTWV